MATLEPAKRFIGEITSLLAKFEEKSRANYESHFSVTFTFWNCAKSMGFLAKARDTFDKSRFPSVAWDHQSRA